MRRRRLLLWLGVLTLLGLVICLHLSGLLAFKVVEVEVKQTSTRQNAPQRW
jgi:hypothetical protein